MNYFKTTANWSDFKQFCIDKLSNHKGDYGVMYELKEGKVDIFVASSNSALIKTTNDTFPLTQVETYPSSVFDGEFGGFGESAFFPTKGLFE